MWFNPDETTSARRDSSARHEQSVVNKLHDIGTFSMDKKELLTNLCGYVFCGTACTVIGIVFCIIIPITNIFIGIIYVYECPREYMIPIYLMVAGGMVLIRGFLTVTELYLKRKTEVAIGEVQPRKTAFKVLDVINGLFLLAWFIAGNVWIFRIHRDHQERASNQQNFCAPVLYQYAFWSTLAVYIIALAAIVITFIVALIACGYIGTKLTDTSKKSESTQVDASV